MGESDCVSHAQLELSDPGLHDRSTTVSNTVSSAVDSVSPKPDNSVTVCLNSTDIIQSDTSVSSYSPVVLVSDLCVPEPSDSGNARSVFSELANKDFPAVELNKGLLFHPRLTYTLLLALYPPGLFYSSAC